MKQIATKNKAAVLIISKTTSEQHAQEKNCFSDSSQTPSVKHKITVSHSLH